MAIKVSTEAIYAGIKTGLKKNATETGEQWAALVFKAIEYYKGVTIDSSQMTDPNLTIFPPDTFDKNSLIVGTKYLLSLSVSGSKNSSYPQFELIAFKQV